MEFLNPHLNLKQIAESGQAFRWYPIEDAYVVVAGHEVAIFSQKEDTIRVEPLVGKGLHWASYLDLETDYGFLKDRLSGIHSYLDEAMAYGHGIRVLKQDPYEITMTFIISANNNINRITNAVNALAESYGTLLCSYKGVDYYDFPTPDQLKAVSIQDFRDCGVGYRDKYLYGLVQSLGKGLDLNRLKALPDDELKVALLRLMGVGEKVANCILLFGYYRTNQFPIDTWMKKVLIKMGAKEKHLEGFVQKHFPAYGGIAQQYLFYYGRLSKI